MTTKNEVQNTLSRAVAYITYDGDFERYMKDHEYTHGEATANWSKCQDAYHIILACEDDIDILHNHFFTC